jgi:hypothetical protein
VVSLLTGALTLGITGTGARAVTPESGTVHVVGLPLIVRLECASCSFSVLATSVGDIAGIDGSTAYEVLWPQQAGTLNNFSGTISYGSSCAAGTVWAGAALTTSTAVVTGALLNYGGVSYPATVTFTFTGLIVPGAFEPVTSQVQIDGGPFRILFGVLRGTGAMATVPTPPVATSCVTGTQTFTASGSFLTLG